ncbi:cupin domain-containing protein [Flavobacterium orientale]|uniref:Cupin type-2 domain-containing protein n=1 Tax=Flavobacterium orientale TaxID=1756020 RepID=A0A917D871_9FLAO|nr:cupin domain-containing protein [Flavobacterium orientale]GGD14110.1 hypothetical protein GCM10011343_01450 [Flavobacterium orientale]
MKTTVFKEQLNVLGNRITVLAGADAATGFAIMTEEVPPLGGPPPHSHPDEEIFYVLEGNFEFVLHDVKHPFTALPGSLVHVPSEALHTYKNTGNTKGKLLVTLLPGNLLDYFRAIGESLPIGTSMDLSSPPDVNAIDFGKVFEEAPKHGIHFYFPETI